ncbi:cytochrome c oxidase subunit II [Fulvivirga sedimenti]|uniref:Cytochrome c oxidase subunit 2 n=1 Tax=Fulvivirga sedimenti TaxID=2879465 RepID=A0A9X1HN45_9BACT|nr:cytochrome c oxidase subunit II [Fulvivirga sedimenti]MCA6073632.1 cytochrome c oxidase subunit II [Fulvivirga sedimenti]
MFEVVVVLGVVLLLIILVTLFRIGKLVGIVKGGSGRKEIRTSNKVNAALMMVFLIGSFGLFFWYSWRYFDDYTLPVASEHGVLTDQLFWVTMAVTGFIFVLTNILLFYFSWKYQYKEGERAKFYPDNMKIEVIWTIVPALVLTVLVFTGLRAWNDITSEAAEDAEVVEIMGYQFGWGLRYPGVKDNELGDYNYKLIDASNQWGMDLTDENSYDDFTPIELHIPKGREILFKIRARDVLHSVFAPHFRLKMDAVPGMPTHFKFTATKTTEEMKAETKDPDFEYFITCTEICGRGHFSMKLKVVVDEPADYQAWKAEQPTWLKLNPEYLEKIPAEKRELAVIKSGIDQAQLNELEASL